MHFPKEADFVCVYGWDGTLYREALIWVGGHRRVVFVCHEERVSSDPRVKIYTIESPLQIGPLIKKIAWSAVFRNMVVVEVLDGTEFKEELEKCHLAADLILSESADWGAAILQNARANRSLYRRGLELKGAFAGLPALVVGAGPSLEKNGHLLKAFENKALILAGGSALHAIDVEPHFAASIDPAAPDQQRAMQPINTPFCYQSRMYAKNLPWIHGPKLLFPDSSSDAINWLDGEESFDSGWTVGNFLTAIALLFGCDPIVFVGMDLCYTHNRKYAHIETVLPDNLIRIGEVLTQRDWLMAAKWTQEKQGPFINATEGGILSLPKMRLEDFLASCKKTRHLRKTVNEAVQKLPFVFPNDRFLEWDASLLRCQKNKAHLEEEISYQKLLWPLWQIWKPIFEREVEIDPQQKIEIHKIAFFQQVLQEHIHG